MNHPFLSIIISTYNRSYSLQECLNSILAQNYPHLEIIITDDNSTDDTESVCALYIRQYPFIQYFKNSRYPKGPNGNKNNGLDYASGELIGIFDDDDTMIDGAISLMVSKIIEGYDMVYANCMISSNRYDNGHFSGKGLFSSGEVTYKQMLCGEISGEFWAIFKADLIKDKRFDTDLYGGEGTLWRGLWKNSKVYYIHKAVRNYRINISSVTHQMLQHANKAIKNYERDTEYYGEEMKIFCPCYLATIYKGAAYYAKLSSQYAKAFKYIFKSLFLCMQKEALLMFFALFLPTVLIPFLSRVRVFFKTGWWQK